MKIYFTASLTGKKYYKANYLKILTLLENLGCKVVHNDIIRMTKEKVNKKNKNERIAFIKSLNKNIKWCDAIVVEVSYPSTSIGYEIALAKTIN